jgi:hypothetical protein
MAIVSFFFMYLTPFNDFLPSTEFRGAFSATSELRLAQKGAAGQYLWATLMYTLPLLALLTRWRPPFGTATLLIGLPALGVGMIDPLLLETQALALSGVAMGALADVLILWLNPSTAKVRSLVLFGAIAPLPLTVVSLVVIEARWGVGWTIDFVTGIVALSALVGAAAAILISLPGTVGTEVAS